MRLNEIDAYKPISDDVEKLLKKYESVLETYYDSDVMIFRGMRNSGEIVFGDGNKLNRSSANTQNYYTLFMDNDPKWQDYPKRSKSFICSMNSTTANGYGTLYVVVPLENQPIGVCPKEDFWFSFKEFKPNALNTAVEMFNYYCNQIDPSFPEIPENSYAGMINVFNRMDALFKADPSKFEDFVDDYSFRELRKLGYLTTPNLKQIFETAYDPTTNGFNVVSNYNDIDEIKSEVWLSGKVLFINYKDAWSAISRYFIKKQEG